MWMGDTASKAGIVALGLEAFHVCTHSCGLTLGSPYTWSHRNFHALTRLDENRAKCQLALKSGKFYTSVSRVAIWGNHSTTQVRQGPTFNFLPLWTYIVHSKGLFVGGI